jgi:hypothetical protein
MHFVASLLYLFATSAVLGDAQAPSVFGASSVPGKEASKTDTEPLLAKLEIALQEGEGFVSPARLARLEKELTTMYSAIPKTEDGRISYTGARYLLHRLFAHRYGWQVKGTGPQTEAQTNNTQGVNLRQENVPALVKAMLGNHGEDEGLELQQVAILAAAVETAVRQEVGKQLRGVYNLMDLPTQGRLAEPQLLQAIESYMALFIIGKNYTHIVEAKELENLRTHFSKVFPPWDSMRQFMREIRRSVIAESKAGPIAAGTFATTVAVTSDIGEQFGRWHNSRCHYLKQKLVKLEDRVMSTPIFLVPGRVPTDVFYGSALQGTWQFSESVDYLRQLGALDETVPSQTSVIIPNYIAGASNCFGSSSYYAVCCINECEALMRTIEKSVAAPTATPAQIAKLVASMSSDTVEAPRYLSESLLLHLNDIAGQHDGEVVLHGRLFAQWMHHAFPHECPFPHKSGTTVQLPVDEWMDKTGKEAVFDFEDMKTNMADAIQRRIREANRTGVHNAPLTMDQKLPWVTEEEIFIGVPRSVKALEPPVWVSSQGIMLVMVLVSMIVSLIGKMSTAWRHARHTAGVPGVKGSAPLKLAEA